MSQNNSNAKTAMLAKLDSIHKVEGFDPSPFAVDYTDLNTQETRKRLPVMIQMAWFRLKYPEGRIAIQVSPGKDCFVATARIYPSYKDPVDCYLAEATASRGPDASKPSVSPREWAQTAAVGIALRNAGLGFSSQRPETISPTWRRMNCLPARWTRTGSHRLWSSLYRQRLSRHTNRQF